MCGIPFISGAERSSKLDIKASEFTLIEAVETREFKCIACQQAEFSARLCGACGSIYCLWVHQRLCHHPGKRNQVLCGLFPRLIREEMGGRPAFFFCSAKLKIKVLDYSI